MTPKERAAAALNLQTPDMVPTFELEFQLAEEMFGRPFFGAQFSEENQRKMSRKEKDRAIYEEAEYTAEVYSKLEYSIIPAHGYELKDPNDLALYHRCLREIVGDTVMLGS
ncbi:MAG: hypothetical protein ACLVG9_05165, partial [Eubacteriales bacterium]